jgi:malate dehydrogenase (oxaloacetate-decarboxylating)(NADP+)
MDAKPIIFALANPDPEISYDEAKEANPDAIVATGRSDYPNQVNNVLGFPFIFRGALDVQASAINEEMKLAAAKSLASLAKETVPESVTRAYSEQTLEFGPEYIIPKPFDPRVFVWTTYAVAEAAINSGVARRKLDLKAYREKLLQKIDWSREFMRDIHILARKEKKRIVFPEGTHPKIIWAASEIALSGIGRPVLLTKDKQSLIDAFEMLRHSHEGIDIIEPKRYHARDNFVEKYYQLGQRRGVSPLAARLKMRNYFDFGAMMVREGHADAMVGGITSNYQDLLRPVLHIIGPRKGFNQIAGLYILRHEDKIYCFADCAVNINPDAQGMAEIAVLAGQELEQWDITPRIAFLSFSNFGTARTAETVKVTKAVEILHNLKPEWEADGPMQADVATNLDYMESHFPFVKYSERPNLFIFPTLDAGNISFKLLTKFANAHYIGPVLIGLDKPVQILTRMTEVNNIVNLAAIASVDAATGV